MIASYIVLALLFVYVTGKSLTTECASIADLSGKYHSNSSKCIALFNTTKTWSLAYDDCATRGMRNSYLGRLLTQIDNAQWNFTVNSFSNQISDVWIGPTKNPIGTTTILKVFWALTPKTKLSNSSLTLPSSVTADVSSTAENCLRAASATQWADKSCTVSYNYFCEYTDALCPDKEWSPWSACSMTCDQGVQSRSKIVYIGYNCTKTTKEFEYQSCSTGTDCYAKSTKITSLKSQCATFNGYYAYSTCYFLANTSTGDPETICANQNAALASFFGPDLVSQLGSVFLSTDSVQGLTSLRLISGSLKWSLNNTDYPFLSNETILLPTQSCISLISKKSSMGAVAELPHLNYTSCNDLLNRPICMRSDHIYSSYASTEGKLITEETSEEPSYELDAHACGARCSRIISCLGFNYRSSDMSCIPTRVSIRTPSVIASSTVYTVESNAEWTFYDRT
uniref:C-type lectin domain-containing protein n=1 Tax=Plectus sambesii TaxID=2011161 RepID=A0A914VVK3_9BILA